MPVIPRHKTAHGAWCRFSGMASRSGICLMCAPGPSLSEREWAALATLNRAEAPVTGGQLATLMCAAGRDTSAAAAHQAGAALGRKELAVRDRPAGTGHVRYAITSQGRSWLSRYLAAGGHAGRASGPGAIVAMTTPRTGPGQVDLVATDASGQPVTVGTAKAISAGFWEAELRRAHPSLGPQGPAGRGPMAHKLSGLRQLLTQSIEKAGPWWR